MLLSSQLAVFLFIGLFCVHPGRGQHDTEFENDYPDLPDMLSVMNSIANTAEDLEDMNYDEESFPMLEQYSNQLPIKESLQQYVEDLLSNADNETKRCFQDMDYVFRNPMANDKVGLKMLDAFGKPESGILEGNLKWVGNYRECSNVYVPLNENSTAGDFKGQYCLLGASLEVYNRTVAVTVGVCLPDSCGPVPPEMFNVSQIMGYHVNITQKTCQLTSRKLTPGAIAMICVLSFFVLLALVGSSITVYEYITKMISQDTLVQYNGEINEASMGKQIQDSSTEATFSPGQRDHNGWYAKAREFFTCFCIFTNGQKILDTNNTEGQMLCLHGIRFLSMTWVIVCHAYGLLIINLGNPVETARTINTFLFQIILNGFFSVDSFFLLSGFLLAYLYFQEAAKKKGKISWLYFYIHRYVRLTPVYAVVLGFLTTLQNYVASGPFWQVYETEPVCQDNWIFNMLYVNNLRDPAKNCMAWTWYLCNDMQFFIISPIILITLWRWPKIGYSVLGLFMSVTVAANLGITYNYELLVGFGKFGSPEQVLTTIQAVNEKEGKYYKYIYIKPYARIGPYLAGIAVAYFLFKRKQSNARKLSLITLVCGWIVAAAISITCLFSLYNRELSLTGSAFYNAFAHTCFGIGLSWVIFTCLSKQAEPVDRILSFKPFIPLSRLTYCAYLIHPLIYTAYFGAMKTTLDFSHFTMVSLFLGLLVITYAFSFILSVLLESPIIRLEKLVRTKLMS